MAKFGPPTGRSRESEVTREKKKTSNPITKVGETLIASAGDSAKSNTTPGTPLDDIDTSSEGVTLPNNIAEAVANAVRGGANIVIILLSSRSTREADVPGQIIE